MVDRELIKKILLENGIDSINIKGLKLVSRLLKDKEDSELVRKIYDTDFDIDVDRKMLIDYINYYGIENIYIGDRVNFYSNGVIKVRNRNGVNLTPDIRSGNKSLFKHEEHDYYYYDLLDDDRRCEQVSPDIFYIRYGCDNMKGISSILYKAKEKVRR